MSIASQFTEAHSRPSDEEIDRIYAASAAKAREKTLARLMAERDAAKQEAASLKQQLSAAENDRAASAQSELDAEAKVKALQAELQDARAQHQDDLNEIALLRCREREFEIQLDHNTFAMQDAAKKIEDLRRFQGWQKRYIAELQGERRREIDREFLRHGDDMDAQVKQEFLDERAWLDQGAVKGSAKNDKAA